MPTIFRFGPYRFFFFSNEGTEPPHVHVESAGNYAKYWINPVKFERSTGFRPYELTEIRRIIIEHEKMIEDKWNEHFGSA